MPDTIAQVANAIEVAKKTVRSLLSPAHTEVNSRASPDWDISV